MHEKVIHSTTVQKIQKTNYFRFHRQTSHRDTNIPNLYPNNDIVAHSKKKKKNNDIVALRQR